jgi:hypothetical protein
VGAPGGLSYHGCGDKNASVVELVMQGEGASLSAVDCSFSVVFTQGRVVMFMFNE